METFGKNTHWKVLSEIGDLQILEKNSKSIKIWATFLKKKIFEEVLLLLKMVDVLVNTFVWGHVWMIASASASEFAKIELCQRYYSESLWMVAETSVSNLGNWIRHSHFSRVFLNFHGNLLSQLTFTCEMSTTETLEKGVKYVQI